MYSKEQRDLELLKQYGKRHCEECKTLIIGRSDKKFCDDACRNNYNNRTKGGDSVVIRSVNQVLKRNRRILKQFLERGMNKPQRMHLLQSGFSFEHFTGKKVIGGSNYLFIYEYGFLHLDNDAILIVKSNESENGNEL